MLSFLTGIKTFFLGDLGKILIWGFIALIAIIVIPNLNQISERLGFETRASLKTKLNQEENNTNVALHANQTLETSVGVLQNTQLNVNNTITDHIDTLQKTEETVRNVTRKTERKIKVIENDTKLKEAEKTAQISEAQINSIWETYCSFNENPQCQGT